MSHFSKLDKIPPDAVFGLFQSYLQDTRQDKINLGIGVYYNAALQHEILPSVKMAEKALSDIESSKVYLPIDGDFSYLEEVKKLVLGDSIIKSKGKHLFASQAIGGTGALRTAADVLKSITSHVYISDPTWANHAGIFKRAGFQVESYPYYDMSKQALCFDKMIQFFEKLPAKSAVVLHGCCHNPTGCDLSHAEWKILSEVMLKKGLIPIFDVAYLGYGSGLEEDSYAIRLFAEKGHEMFICLSFSKIFGLYAERVGAMIFMGEDLHAAEAVGSHAKLMIRGNYSNPPKHGALIVSYILNNTALRQQWHEELKTMRQRIHLMRSKFAAAMTFQAKRYNYEFLHHRYGLFAYTGLHEDVVDKLREDNAIYMPSDGRINISALNDDNIEVVVSAIIKTANLY